MGLYVQAAPADKPRRAAEVLLALSMRNGAVNFTFNGTLINSAAAVHDAARKFLTGTCVMRDGEALGLGAVGGSVLAAGVGSVAFDGVVVDGSSVAGGGGGAIGVSLGTTAPSSVSELLALNIKSRYGGVLWEEQPEAEGPYVGMRDVVTKGVSALRGGPVRFLSGTIDNYETLRQVCFGDNTFVSGNRNEEDLTRLPPLDIRLRR